MTDIISRYQLPAETHKTIAKVVVNYIKKEQLSPRLKVELTDLTNDIDYSSPYADSVVKGLREFELGRMNLSVNSQRTLNSVLRSFVSFCRTMEVKALPLDEMTLLAYYITLDSTGKSFNTIKQHIAQLSKITEITRTPNHNKHTILKGFITSLEERMAQEADPRLTPNQAPSMHHYHVKKLVERWGMSSRAIHHRDLATIVLAYGTSLRQEELSRVQLKDVLVNSDGYLTVQRRISKTQKRDLAPKALKPSLAKFVLKQIELLGQPTDSNVLLLSKVSPKGDSAIPSTTPLTTKTMNGIFERAYLALHPDMKKRKESLIAEHGRDKVRKTDYDPDGLIFTAHSGRVGSVVDAYENRHELEIEDTDLMRMGDWKRIDMVLHYTRHLRVQHEGNIKSQHLIDI